jgi:SAM-dependent methyltransferase
MASDAEQAPRNPVSFEARFRPNVPSTARMYDYYLGGKDNYPADRDAAEKAIRMMPDGVVRTSAVQNRRFLIRVVRHLTGELGIRQFLDIGTGLPTMNNVHEVAQSIAQESRVVYVDHDPIVLAHARDLLHGVDNTTIIEYDLREPEAILADPTVNAMLDFSKPVAVLLVAIVHFVQDKDDPYGIMRTLMNAVPSGSCLVLSHFTADSYSKADEAAHVYDKATSTLHSRTRAQVAELFAGLDLIEPGVVWTPQWHPDADTGLADNPGKSLFWCGVARKPLSTVQPQTSLRLFRRKALLDLRIDILRQRAFLRDRDVVAEMSDA